MVRLINHYRELAVILCLWRIHPIRNKILSYVIEKKRRLETT